MWVTRGFLDLFMCFSIRQHEYAVLPPWGLSRFLRCGTCGFAWRRFRMEGLRHVFCGNGCEIQRRILEEQMHGSIQPGAHQHFVFGPR